MTYCTDSAPTASSLPGETMAGSIDQTETMGDRLRAGGAFVVDRFVGPMLDGLVRHIDALRARLAGHRLRASVFFATVVAALSSVNIIKASTPKTTIWGRPWVIGVIAGANFFIAVVTVAFVRDYRRVVRAREIDDEPLQEACREIAARVVELTRVRAETVGVHLWILGGIWGFRHLERVASDKPGIQMHVIWRKRKGALGRAWKVRSDIVCFLGDANDIHSRAEFNALPAESRGYVRWHDFTRMKGKFSAVAAIPLELTIDGSRSFRGCISINVLGPDTLPKRRFDSFEQAIRSDPKIGELFAAAQAALQEREEKLRSVS
jgi:hypothetical protein